jgi:hypothetical protein
MNTSQKSQQDLKALIVGTIATTAVALAIFIRYLPGPAGFGHDYALFLPAVLAEHYGAMQQGLWATIWFTPAFCGGVPLFADPQWGFFGLPSFLVRVLGLGPIESLRVTFGIFVALGFIGTYLFTSRRLGVSTAGSALAAFLFASNGFFIYRFLIGHLGFHGIALIPLMAFFATTSIKQHIKPWTPHLMPVLGMSLIAAYWVHSAAVSILPAFLLATAALVLLNWLRDGSVRTTLQRTTGGIVLGLSLSASKLVAGLSFLENAPRTGYVLPGFIDIVTTIKLAASMLFVNDVEIATAAARNMLNAQWLLDRHELEFGVTLVPILLVVIALSVRFFSKSAASEPKSEFSAFDPKFNSISRTRLASAIGIAGILILPLALNTYSPEWNAFLKSLPILGSTSSYVRWFLIYVPVIACASGLLVDRISSKTRAQTFIAGISILLASIQILSTDRSFYSTQNYNPRPILDAFQKSKAINFSPQISKIDAYVNQAGQVVLTGNRNDLIVDGVSQLACYNPAFGYQLEFFPFKTLTFGDTLSRQGEFLNIKNPACYVYPKENSCAPGDHFRADQLEDAKRFTSYKSFNFKKSRLQHWADTLTTLALLVCIVIIMWSARTFLRIPIWLNAKK